MKIVAKIFILLFIYSMVGANTNQHFLSNVKVAGTKQPVKILNGTWKFTMNPPEKFWLNEVNPAEWSDIQVPGECAMQGFAIRHDIPYVYKIQIAIPKDYENKIVKLKFYGVYSYARVWVNSIFIRDHYGGFTAWECDISEHVNPGTMVWLTVEITDKKDELSYGSGYAKHQIGGILRDVWLMALPKNHLKKLYVETDFDKNFQNAELKIEIKPALQAKAFVKIKLFDLTGDEINLPQNRYKLTGKNQSISIPVKNPQKWDAEHPNLYTLVTELTDSIGKVTMAKAEKIGFREVEVKDNLLLVNGKPVKLRGACRHDIHPLLGRTTSPEYDKKDVLLAKEANMNFIRTSHYPPSEAFLNYCDEYGIFVEDETAVCFYGSHRTKAYMEIKHTGPEYQHQFLSQVKEMVHYHGNHPSIIIWSVGNENTYDENFKLSYDYIKSTDKTRPIIFSYPGGVPDAKKCYDILSMHYPSYEGHVANQRGISIRNFEYEKMPALFDEWAHVACYNNPILQIDPNVRNFWGQSLDKMWTNLFESKGGLGGAIWGYIDETFMLPETLPGYKKWWGVLDKNVIPAEYKGHCVGYGEWGIIDTWRRKKPEFWNTKKAYSPTKILVKEIKDFQPAKDLKIPVYNRFDFTNFDELKIVWTYKNNSGTITDFNLEPHRRGRLIIPASDWENDESIRIKFFGNDQSIIDAYNLRFGSRHVELPVCQAGKIQAKEKQGSVTLKSKKFSVQINKNTGQIENVVVAEDTLVKSGPHLFLSIPEKLHWSTMKMINLATDWQLSDFFYNIEDGIAHIYGKGNYGGIKFSYYVQIDEHGTVIIDHKANNIETENPIQEAGLYFIVGDQFEKLAWQRKAYWSTYPDGHLGANNGIINIANNLAMTYRELPNHPWEEDTKDFYYHGIDKKLPITNAARALKENIYVYSLMTSGGNELTVLAKGDKACRLDKKDQGNLLYINHQWDYTSLGWGNYMKRYKSAKEYNDKIVIKINANK
jgi:beta-galactosidase